MTAKHGIPKKLTHREAELVLEVMNPDKTEGQMSETELLAVAHYVKCTSCQSTGISQIRGQNISCKEAILIWATDPRALFLRSSLKTLKELLAAEHVWGLNRPGFHPGACILPSCEKLAAFWDDIPMDSHLEGSEGPINIFPVLLDIFIQEKWILDELFQIQTNRINILLGNIKSGKITVSMGHYHDISELETELLVHITSLQSLAKDNAHQIELLTI